MLALVPTGTTMAIWADLAKARSSPLVRRIEADTRWRTLAGCEINAEEVLLAMDERGPTAWVLRGGDAARLEQCGSMKLRRVDPRTVVLAPQRTARRIPAPAKRAGSARRRTALSGLLCGVPRGRSVAFAATLGPKARGRLSEMPALRDSGTLRSVVGSADFTDGLRVSLRARLGSRRAATNVAKGIEHEIDGWRRQPMVLISGLLPVLEGVQVRADGADATIQAGMDAAALGRLMQQIEVLSGTKARNP